MSFAEGDRVRVIVHAGDGTLLSGYWGKEGEVIGVDARSIAQFPFKVKMESGDTFGFTKTEIEKVVLLQESGVDMAEFDIEAQQLEALEELRTKLNTQPSPKALYLAGPMTGIKDYNFPMFDKVAGILRAAGYVVFNPAENDRENGFDATGLEGHEAHEHGFSLRQALKQDLSWICDHADGIALLPGWEESKGVKAELALANALGMEFQLWSDYLFEAVSPEGKAA